MGRAEINAENPKYITEMIEVLSYLTDDDRAALCHPTKGLQTTCKYLPSPADVHEFLRAHRARVEQFKPSPRTGIYKLLEPDDPSAPWNRETDYERKRRVVREMLGYNPGETKPKRELVPATAADIENVKGLCKIVQPSVSDASPQLRKWIAQQEGRSNGDE